MTIEDSGDSFVLTFFDDAIAGYPRGTWLSLEKQVLSLPAFSKKARALSRVLASRAHESRLDTQGRILVPPALRRLAGLERDVIVIGAMDRFEIWPRDKWNTFAERRGGPSGRRFHRAGLRPSPALPQSKPRRPLAFASLRLTVRRPWPRVAVENIGQKWSVWARTCCAVTILHE